MIHLLCPACGLSRRRISTFGSHQFKSLQNLPPILAHLIFCRGLRVYVTVRCSCWPPVEMLYLSSALIYVPIRHLILASSSTNYLQKTSKIPQFSTKNAQNSTKPTTFYSVLYLCPFYFSLLLGIYPQSPTQIGHFISFKYVALY